MTSVIVLGLLVGAGACVWGTSRALQDPAISFAATTEEDAARAQQKLFRLFRGVREPVVLSEAELNAFLSRNVDARDWPFERSSVSLQNGGLVEILGSVPLRRLLAESPLPFVADLLPADWLVRPIWLRVGSHATFEREPRSQLRLDVRQVTVGRQRVPTVALRLLFEPASLRFVRVSLPDSVADVRIETGRAVIRPASSRGRT